MKSGRGVGEVGKCVHMSDKPLHLKTIKKFSVSKFPTHIFQEFPNRQDNMASSTHFY